MGNFDDRDRVSSGISVIAYTTTPRPAPPPQNPAQPNHPNPKTVDPSLTRTVSQPSAFNVLFSGGTKIALPTMAVGELPDGRRLEIGFRKDFREESEVCFVFHALYL